MSEPYSAAPRPGQSDSHDYVPGETLDSSGPTPIAYVPVDPSVTAGVGQTYAETLARAGATTASERPPSASRAPAVGNRRRDGERFRFPGTETLNPAEIFRGPGYEAPRPASSKMAAWGLSLGLLGFIPFLSPVALALGMAALGETADGSRSGRGKAEAAVSLGAMGTIIWLLILTAYLVNR